MIKYKVSFEVKNVLSEFMPFNKEKWTEMQKGLIKSSIYDMEFECEGIDLMKVTDFSIEEVEQND